MQCYNYFVCILIAYNFECLFFHINQCLPCCSTRESKCVTYLVMGIILYQHMQSASMKQLRFPVCCFMVYSTRRFVLWLALCYFCSCVFTVLSPLRVPRFRKRELGLGAFSYVLFDLRLFCFVCFPPFGVCEGLRFVIVALPGLFEYPFFLHTIIEVQVKSQIIYLKQTAYSLL